MKSAIVFTSISGNTEEVAELISETIKTNGGECDLFRAGRFAANLSLYNIVLFGSYTWGDGKLPLDMRNQLRLLLIENETKIQRAATFGTGDTNYHFYCRAVDEMRYHLINHNVEVIGDGLKIEQSCRGTQEHLVKSWTENIIKGVSIKL
jgi:flavodoxin I